MDTFPTTRSPEALESLEGSFQEPSVNVYRSWPAIGINYLFRLIQQLAGFASMIVLLAVVANIPLLQVLSFGYLLEASGRVAKTGRLSQGFPGLEKAAQLMGGVLGTLLCLVPLWLISKQWYAAYLINPTSDVTRWLRAGQVVTLGLTLPHLLFAWFCGGQLKQFVWPIVAPFSISMWLLRKGLAANQLRNFLHSFLKYISPHLLHDIGKVQPIRNWFLPSIVWDRWRRGVLWITAREQLWSFVVSIPWRRLATIGGLGFVGTLLWLFLPTCLLILATQRLSGWLVFVGIMGIWLATIVFALLLPLQTHFAVTGRFQQLFDLRGAWQPVRRAPIWHCLAVLLTLLLSLPLFLAKIEEIPRELLWMLSLFFVSVGWISRIALGWAYAQSQDSLQPPAAWRSWPPILLILPMSLAFVLIMFLTRYVSWHGAWSMIENPVFLLPAPFWLA